MIENKIDVQNSFSPYPDDILPEGFRYPAGYLAHAESMEYPKGFRWWFIDNNMHGPMEWEFRLFNKEEGWRALSDIDPIPFARSGDFAAFFDGNDRGGDPKIVVVDLGNKAYGAAYANFDAWLNSALKESGLK